MKCIYRYYQIWRIQPTSSNGSSIFGKGAVPTCQIKHGNGLLRYLYDAEYGRTSFNKKLSKTYKQFTPKFIETGSNYKYIQQRSANYTMNKPSIELNFH